MTVYRGIFGNVGNKTSRFHSSLEEIPVANSNKWDQWRYLKEVFPVKCFGDKSC